MTLSEFFGGIVKGVGLVETRTKFRVLKMTFMTRLKLLGCHKLLKLT